MGENMKAFFAVLIAGIFVSPCRFSGGMKHPRVSGDFNSIGAGLRMYKTNNGAFPATSQGLSALVTKPEASPPLECWTKLMDHIPLDPWQAEYRLFSVSDQSISAPFELRSAGPDGIFDTEDDISSLDD